VTLRLRLVIALVALVTVGLVLFGVTTYTFYARDRQQRLDAQLRNSEPLIDAQLDERSRGSSGPPLPPGAGPGGGRGGPPIDIPSGTFAELRDAAGKVVSQIQNSTHLPRLPNPLPPPTPHGRLFTVGSTSGSGRFRVLLSPGRDGGTTVIAASTSEITDALHQLVLLEVGGGLILLVVLSAGSWLILRRGLRPLERMAGTARSITAGDLSQRVSPSGGASEVGQLGLALNSMLDGIEGAFEERDATEQRLRQFLADVSHELRTPLTSIQGFAELFRVSGDSAQIDLPTILRRIEGESARMKLLVDDLLLLARLDQTRTAEREPVDLAVLAADACSDAVASAPQRAVSLDAPEPVVVAGDQSHLRQAISNLMTNAVRHTPPGSPIEVSARLANGSAVVSIRDHGAGLDNEALTHAFDRFWQADRSRVGTGAGLGLAIVSSIAAEHGGHATAGNAPGGGAVFTLELPIAPAPALTPTARSRSPGRD